MNMRRRLTRGAVLGTLAGLGARRASSAEAFAMRLSLPDAVTSFKTTAALRLAAAVGRRSNGQLTIEVYPSGQLIAQQGTLDALTSGVLDMTILPSVFLVPLVPQYEAFDLPFLCKNTAAGLRLIDGPIGDQFLAQLEPKGIVGLGWGLDGFRELETTSKAVVAPDDLKGMRIRIQGGPIYVATFQALGAIPVTIDRAELFTALSQHTVDGMEVSLEGFTTFKDYVIVKHLAMTNHVFSVSPLLVGKRKLEALPAPLQKILREEAKAVMPFWRALVAQKNAASIEILKQNGVALTEIPYAAFRKQVEPVYTMAAAKIGKDLVDRLARASAG